MALPSDSLLDTLDNGDGNDINDDETPIIFQHSPYYELQTAINVLKEKQNVFSVLSLNCQSLHAKIDQLKLYLHYFNESSVHFSAICLQETWLSDNTDTSQLQLEGYTLISKGKSCSAHGGVAIYLRREFDYDILDVSCDVNVWDGLFVKVSISDNNLSKNFKK